jgi:RNA polymerase sigma-70 factor (sigma-E family)
MGMAKVSTAITGFENFAAREYPRLVAALTLLVRDRGVAEELAQDALVRTYERWGRVREMSAPGPWVHRVAVNGGVSWLRRRSAERRALRRNGPAVAEPWDDAEVLAVRRAVSNLPRRQRQAIVYRYYFGYSTAETAELMGIRPGSLKSAVTRAFATLRAELDTASHVTSLGVPHE